MTSTSLAAWTPILEPMPIAGGQWWITILPLALGIALAYKAVRSPSLPTSWWGYFRGVGILTAQILILILSLAVGLHIVVTWAAPALGG